MNLQRVSFTQCAHFCVLVQPIIWPLIISIIGIFLLGICASCSYIIWECCWFVQTRLKFNKKSAERLLLIVLVRQEFG